MKERSEQFLATEYFFDLFLEVSQFSKIWTIRIQIGKKYCKLEKLHFWNYLCKVKSSILMKWLLLIREMKKINVLTNVLLKIVHTVKISNVSHVVEHFWGLDLTSHIMFEHTKQCHQNMKEERLLRWEISGFSLLSFCQISHFSAFSFCIFFEESVFIFQFLNDKIHNYVHNCEFHHSKIEN